MSIAQKVSAMSRHWKGILTIFFVTVTVFIIGIVTDSTYLAVVSLISGLVMSFVIAVAWSRPSGSPKERHAEHDRLMNDTRP